MRRPLHEAPSSRFTFVVGKGGVGKSTTAAALSLAWCDRGHAVHLVSTDPAPSIADIFGISLNGASATSPCSPNLTLEELDAERITTGWMDRVRAPLEQIVEQGTYLDRADVSRITHLTLPGIDELGAALRIAELAAADGFIVVDTAPTGHTLRLLDAADLIDSWADVFTAMADKVATIALTMVRARVKLPGESAIDEMRATAKAFRNALHDASFVIVTRAGEVVTAESERLAAQLRARKLDISAVVTVATEDGRGSDAAELKRIISGDVSIAVMNIPRLTNVSGCEGLRSWLQGAADSPVPFQKATSQPASSRAPGVAIGNARAWIMSKTQRLLWFAGKGGTGKSTCAAAVSLALAADRAVLLCSTDPAGSLADVLPDPHGRLRVMQIDAAAQLDEWRVRYRDEADRIFAQLSTGGSATLDQQIMRTLWEAVPPGIDELFAIGGVLDAAEGDEVIVIDAAPTGHFLRLIESPEIALDWTHAILRILLKYGVAGSLEGFSERALAFAKQLKHLRAMMTDASQCGVFVISVDEPVILAQTARLARELDRIGMPVIAEIRNRTHGNARPSSVSREMQLISAPLMAQPPAGASGLDAFINQWELA